MQCKEKGSLTAFDLSLRATGTVSYSNGVVQPPSTLCPLSDLTGMARMDWIMRECHAQLKPDQILVIFEDLAFAAHDRNHERAGLANLVRWMLWRKGIPYLLISPATCKKFSTGSGKGDKSRVQLAVFKRWGVDCEDDNQADAYALLRIGMSLTGIDRAKPTKAQEECLATLRKNPHNAAAMKQLSV